MTKKPKRQNLKGPGKCIFCGGGAVSGNPMSEEHLWSDWMEKDGLLKRSTREYFETASNFRRYLGQTTTVERYREGSPHYKTIKVVCKNCNSGWMSVLETEIKPILTPLIKGSKITLTKPMRRKLTEWITLKMLVAEHSSYQGYTADPIYSQSVRTSFMLERTIPHFLRIYLATHTGTGWAIRYHRRASGLGKLPPSLPPPRNAATRNNVQATTWGVGKLLIYVSGTTSQDVADAFRFIKDPALRKLWPALSKDLAWPPVQIVSDGSIDDLAGSLARFLDGAMK